MDGVAATGRRWLALSKGDRLTRKPDWALKITEENWRLNR